MLERNIRQELSSTVPSPSGMLSSFVRQIRELAQVEARDAFVSVGIVVVRRGMMPFA